MPLPPAANPYADLYIYYLSGRFRPGRDFQPQHYLGCWEEGDFSFLFFTRPNLALVEKTAASLPDVTLIDHYQMTYAQWQGGDIVPCRIGRFTVTPPWFDAASARRRHHRSRSGRGLRHGNPSHHPGLSGSP
ncbi:hypothetical protein [Desulfosarcina cetonica]|uniref:hypothetical protein n=1 Tax=Desulfosarcina cetonica TaxID=90730 RepID=UPI0012EE0BFD|nr:hypothetical protein [Desulfosarcina cetonica]